jgi:hypothetical protein
MLNSLDFLGSQIFISVQNNRIHKTTFGGIASLSLLLAALFAFFGFGKDIFDRVQPRVSLNKVVSEVPPLKVINDKNFLFAIYDQSSDLPLPDFERRFIVYFDYYQYNGVGGSSKMAKIPIEKCSQEVIKIWDGFFYVDSSNYLCFPRNMTWNLNGILNEGAHSLVRLQVDYCKNNTDPTLGQVITNCIPKNETQTLLSSNRIQMHYIIENSLVDNRNYTHPASRIGYTGLVNTNALSWTRMSLLFKKIIVNTDTGFFTQDMRIDDYRGIETVSTESIGSPNTDTIYSHLIGNSRWNEIYNRNYIKIQDVFAQMGGFLNLGMILLRFIVYYATRPKLIDIFNTTYRYLETNSEKNKPLILTRKIHTVNNKKLIHNLSKDPTSSIQRLEEIPTMATPSKENKFKRNFSPSKIESSTSTSEITEKRPFNYFVRNKCKLNYSIKLNKLTSLFRVCCLRRKSFKKINEIYGLTEKKLIKVTSFENLIKMTRFYKLMGVLMLEDYQKQIVKLCPAPRSIKEKRKNKKKSDLNLEEISENLLKNPEKINLKLIDYLKK